jgi:hypothetical protein
MPLVTSVLDTTDRPNFSLAKLAQKTANLPNSFGVTIVFVGNVYFFFEMTNSRNFCKKKRSSKLKQKKKNENDHLACDGCAARGFTSDGEFLERSCYQQYPTME